MVGQWRILEDLESLVGCVLFGNVCGASIVVAVSLWDLVDSRISRTSGFEDTHFKYSICGVSW